MHAAQAAPKSELELTLNDYINDAILAKECESDRALGRLLGLTGAPVCQWRGLKSYPSNEHMSRLAELGGHDPHVAVANLNTWREKGGASIIFKEMARKLATISATAGLLLLVMTSAASAGTLIEQVIPSASSFIYYGKLNIIIIKQ